MARYPHVRYRLAFTSSTSGEFVGIGVVDRKLLWGRSWNICAFPACQQNLTLNLEDPESQILAESGAVIGEEAHIRSGQAKGPRYDEDYPTDKIDSYANLILLCPTHHTIIDKDGGRGFSVTDLEGMRSDHESAMQQSATVEDESYRQLTERMVAAVAVWEEMVGLDDWDSLTWGLNHPVPRLTTELTDNLFRCGRWLLAKDWPDRFPRTKEAFTRFSEILGVTLELVSQHFEPVAGRDSVEMERAYKRIGWDPSLYGELIAEYRLHSIVSRFCAIELTRSANWVLSAVRSELDPLYRFHEGTILMRDGDGIIQNQVVRIEYNGREWGQGFPELTLEGIKTTVLACAKDSGISSEDVNPYALFDL